jgi:diaminopimelate decarboxylase
VHSFRYRDGHLYCEDVDLARVAEELGTPTYVYSAGTILDHYARLDTALQSLDHLICYAVKANSNRAILKLLAGAGAGFDIVSGGELYRVLAAGGDSAKCTFAGVGKSREEIEYALEQRVYSFNVESEAELEHIGRIAEAKETRAPIALRVNPDVDAHTHEYISTGSHENKFGIALDRGGLRAGRQNAARRDCWRANAYRLANCRGEALRERDRKSGANRARAEIKIWNQVPQHWWRDGNCLPARAREWIR